VSKLQGEKRLTAAVNRKMMIAAKPDLSHAVSMWALDWHWVIPSHIAKLIAGHVAGDGVASVLSSCM
jgi:hypothetical protein